MIPLPFLTPAFRVWPYVAVGVVCLAVGGTGAWKVQGWRLGEQLASIREQQATTAAAAQREARTTESRRSLNVLEAQNAATKRAQVARADADRARSELDRLRDQLAARRGGVPNESPAACAVRADTTADVLSACAAEAQELASIADRLNADRLMLLEAWPK